RIYLDNPADSARWLLNPRDPVLPRVLEAVKPLVLPKLREENERNGVSWKGKGKGGGGKKKGVKDLVGTDEFEVSIFLTEHSSRHSILKKQKHFPGTKRGRLGSNTGKMTGTREEPVEVAEGEVEDGTVAVRRESLDETMGIEDVPAAHDVEDEIRKESGLFLSDASEGEDESERTRTPKRRMAAESGEAGGKDDKKKMAMNTTYEGFSIYGRILCLVVKRKGTMRGKEVAGGKGQAMMEEWITSTQIAREDGGMGDE
ncbi:MAG: hypothetical protein Q9187_009176, partial [Circinaria calcarea]